MKPNVVISIVIASLGMALQASALVIPHNKGLWPQTWPQELEPLRDRSSTLDIATGTQERRYRIPFENREEFESCWPHLLKVRTPGSPLTLRLTDEKQAGGKSHVEIAAPTDALVGDVPMVGWRIDELKLKDALANRRVLQPGAPWPSEILGAGGELPEYVTAKTLDGKLCWRAVPPKVEALTFRPTARVADKTSGFRYRSRVEITLCIDGAVVDLNRIPLPSDAKLIDLRFTDE